MNDVLMGSMPTRWLSSKKIKTITFNVTDDCNLACTYCYFVNKSTHRRMNFEIAKQAVDYILSETSFKKYDGVIWDFIGGEPTLEIDLITKICDYILESMYEKKHKWLFCYKFMMCTNGLLYSTPKVQNLIKRHSINLQIAMTIDGSKEKHDLSRKCKDGTGSYDMVVKQLPLWLQQQHTHSTKSTFAHADIPFLKDSIINLWNLGITNVMANVVFENCWEENDAYIFETQLKELGDYILDNKLWDKCSVRFFSPDIGHPLAAEAAQRNFCGTGHMLAIGTTGNLYPCIRFVESSLQGKEGWIIGNVYNGIDSDRLRAFYALDMQAQSPQKCQSCEIASGCAWCSGNNYCDSTCNSIFERKTYICEMHKANVRAAEYFWYKYEKITGLPSPMRKARIENISTYQKYLYVLLEDSFPSICQYTNKQKANENMSNTMVYDVISFCDKNHYIPIFCGKNAYQYKNYGLVIDSFNHSDDEKVAFICHKEDLKSSSNLFGTSIIYKTSKKYLSSLSADIEYLYQHALPNANINVFFEDLLTFSREDLYLYEKQLDTITKIILKYWKQKNEVQLNILTHILNTNIIGMGCESGIKKIAIAPNGKFYPCPAFYFDQDFRELYSIGNLMDGLSNSFENLCDTQKCMGCRNCGAEQCEKCIYINRKSTGEFCVPPEIECLKANIERLYALKLREAAISINVLPNTCAKDSIDNRLYIDPLRPKASELMSKFGDFCLGGQ